MTGKLDKLSELTLKLSQKLDLGSPEGLLDVLKNTAFKSNANNDQMTALLIVANQYSLNPWTKEIYAYPDKNNGIVPIVGVDGWSRILNSHPEYDGIEFLQDDESCTCKIYRKDRKHPTLITEYMGECKRENFGPWKSHPKRMLRHKAMIQCARLAFGFAGIYDQDEAERIIEGNGSDTIINVIPEHKEKPKLTKDSKAWERALLSLKETNSLDTVKEHMSISTDDEAELFVLAGINNQAVNHKQSNDQPF